MNKQQTKEAIEIMQHWLDGGEVEANTESGWHVIQSPPLWAWNVCQYRIKKEPLEVYVLSRDGIKRGSFFLSKDEAINVACGTHEVIKMREVVDES